MADTQTTVAINIGSQRISAAVFEVSKNGGLVLKAYDSESIVADPALDATRISQTRVAINDLAQRMKLGKVKARYALSGQSVLVRFVKLPPIQGDDIEQIVTFEAQQQFPFPLNEVVWDYELIEGASSDKEVVLAAIKSEALDEINASVNDSGLGTAEVDVAPMAIYNAFRATYGQPEEPVLLIDIGAKTSNLLYIEGKRFFTRSIAIGGGAITAAVAKEYNVTFLEAEHQKVANGLVALGGGHTEQMDEAVAALAMVIRNALSRLPAEISRTTNYYRAQHGGSAPRRVLLAGGGANLPYTLEFFQEKLNLPVEYFNPVRNVAIGKGVDSALVQREGHLMGELVGLGLRGIGKSEINIDLVPVVVEQSRAADRRKPFLIASAAMLLLGVAGWAVFQNVAASSAQDKLRTMEETRDKLSPLKTGIESLLKKEADLKKVAEGYIGAEADHVLWMDLLTDVRGAFTSDAVWLTDFEPINEYDPAKALDPVPAGQPRPANGRPVVKPEVFSAPYGTSALADLKSTAPVTPQKGSKPAPVVDKPTTANAIRIKGFWRENPKSQNVVSELVKNLTAKSTSFKFKIPDPNPKNQGKEISLVDDQHLGKFLVITAASGKAGELAQPFEITLPLAREITVK